jgi:hypothetical protein
MDSNEDEVAPSEAARARRRDRDAEAHARAGMKTGLAKQFKQVLDVQRRRADEVERAERAEPPPGTPPRSRKSRSTGPKA